MRKILSCRDQALFYSLFFGAALGKKIGFGHNFFKRQSKKFELNLAKRLGSIPAQAGTEPVERVRNLSPHDFIECYLRRFKPVILEGFCASWPAAKEFTFKTLKEKYGDIEMTLFADKNGLRRTASLKALLQSVEEGSLNRYVRFASLLSKAPQLTYQMGQSEIIKMAGLSPETVFFNLLFLAQKNFLSDLHTEFAYNFLCHFDGEKTMFLYENSQTPLLYPRSNFVTVEEYVIGADIPRDSLLNSQFDNFPLLRHVKGLKAKLYPGDVLFIPPYMWHQALYDTAAISVPAWWIQNKTYFTKHPMFSMLSLSTYLFSQKKIRLHRQKENYQDYTIALA